MAGRPPPSSAVPREILLASAGIATITILVVLAVALRSPGAVEAFEAESAPAARSAASGALPGPSAPPATRATPDEAAAARLGGVGKLAPLAERFPEDAAVLKALLVAHAGEPGGSSAYIRVARRLFEIAPDAAGDKQIQRTLAAIAGGAPEPAAQAFEVIGTKMGSHGPDLLFDIVSGSSATKSTKDRAGQLLQDPDVKKLASPAVAIAYELRESAPCARKPLFRRAREHGDERALPYLKPLASAAGCGGGLGGGLKGLFRKGKGGDCYSECLGAAGVAELKEAIAAIESRTRKVDGGPGP